MTGCGIDREETVKNWHFAEPYLVKSLNDYRKGIRKHDMMTIVVQPLSDQDVADLAAYCAGIEFSVKAP
jgi:cytochrome c553